MASPMRTLASPIVCCRCLRVKATATETARSRNPQFASYSSHSNEKDVRSKSTAARQPSSGSEHKGSRPQTPPEQGAMSRRLEEATQEALFQGGAAGRRAVEDAGFSDELKERLLDKIATAKYRDQFSDDLAEADVSKPASSVGEGTRHIASARPWTGEEEVSDAVLRMLDDAKKPLKPESRGKYKPPPVDTRLKRSPMLSPGQRAASARDRVSLYSGMEMKDSKGLSDREKEEMKREFRERFQPASRAVPVTVSGIAALANERIENAIARGQFKDLPRGRSMERDPRADNPFVDTTEYILNRMIQRQNIVPPWIEKQQELVKAARVFRARLRNDWKRHCARMMAAKGGPLTEQMKRAEDYAAAEEVHNPRILSVDQMAVPTTSTDDPVMTKMRQQEEMAAEAHPAGLQPRNESTPSTPFRDAAWERTEQAYMTLAVDNLNSIARSYNLMAPDLAKKPYFSLSRELAACYAEVAPLVANEIKQRAVGGSLSSRTGRGARGGGGGDVGNSGGGDEVRIHLEADAKAYGLKEWWRDFWKRR